MPIALLFLFLITGGTSFVAKDSLPGEVLYPVKININENIESFLATNDKAEAIVSVKQASRRLEEAEDLASVGKLDTEISLEIRNRFEDEVGEMNKHLEKLNGKGDTQFISELNDKLEVEVDDHFDVFSIVSANATNTPLISKIFQRLEDRHKGRGIDSENSSTSISRKESDDDDDDKRSILREKFEDNEDEDEDEDEDDVRKIGLPLPIPTPIPESIPATESVTSGSVATSFTIAQVSLHNKSTDCYSVVRGNVYNLTSWIGQHPGGASAIKAMCGVDATADFDGQHGGQGRPESELSSFKIGVIK